MLHTGDFNTQYWLTAFCPHSATSSTLGASGMKLPEVNHRPRFIFMPQTMCRPNWRPARSGAVASSSRNQAPAYLSSRRPPTRAAAKSNARFSITSVRRRVLSFRSEFRSGRLRWRGLHIFFCDGSTARTRPNTRSMAKNFYWWSFPTSAYRKIFRPAFMRWPSPAWFPSSPIRNAT